MSSQGIIKIHRKPTFAGGIRSIVVRLNGEKVGKLKNNEKLVLEVPAGEHELRVAMDWARNKVKLMVQPGEEYAFETWMGHHHVFLEAAEDGQG